MDTYTKISRSGNAESVMLSAQVVFLLKNYATIAQLSARSETAKDWQEFYYKLKKVINKYAWDGDWYIRTFADNPQKFQPVGNKTNEEGKIYLNAQSWMIMANIAPVERAQKALTSFTKHLSSDFGPLVFSPSYTEYVDYIGTQSIYAPGFRNGNVYFRPTGWAVMAAAMNDNAEQANDLYNSASLSNRSKDMDRYLLEPFAYPENYIGPDHAHRGESQFHWCFGEGTAWMWYSYVSHILGVRPEIDGLVVDPKIPKEWDTYTVQKIFRDVEYNIEVNNPNHVSEGIKWIKVNGKKIKGNKITTETLRNNSVKVEILIGN
jgi:cellobiose phosphorylase